MQSDKRFEPVWLPFLTRFKILVLTTTSGSRAPVVLTAVPSTLKLEKIGTRVSPVLIGCLFSPHLLECLDDP